MALKARCRLERASDRGSCGSGTHGMLWIAHGVKLVKTSSKCTLEVCEVGNYNLSRAQSVRDGWSMCWSTNSVCPAAAECRDHRHPGAASCIDDLISIFLVLETESSSVPWTYDDSGGIICFEESCWGPRLAERISEWRGERRVRMRSRHAQSPMRLEVIVIIHVGELTWCCCLSSDD